jgi:adenylyltransferase/sulfurtransferase
VHCKVGPRSAAACRVLRAAGFEDVTDVEGGLLAWAAVVDASVDVA